MQVAGLLLAAFVMVLLALRAYDARTGPPLQPWHTYVPDELSAEQLDQEDWNTYLKHENVLFEQVRKQVSDRLPPAARVPSNRYFEGSPIYPPHLNHDWNRSYEMLPTGKPVGAVVLLHGLTDSPYSLRHIARRYVERGFVAVGIRLPGHGTVPAGLSNVDWETWMAATRLAVREAQRRAGPGHPVDLVGFSNGGALAMKYALDSLEDRSLVRPTRVILISPMIGVTRYARFAGLAAIPALLPPFEKAAWLGIVPEFNPFKYNSFPVNAARQSHRLTIELQQQIARLARGRNLGGLPPILTFQSVLDFTVSTSAIINRLYAMLPDNGSELVLFDVNRRAKLGPLIDPASLQALARVFPTLPVNYRMTTIGNAPDGPDDVTERVVEPGAKDARTHNLGLSYPPQIFSLSHVAIPFPPDDALYGTQPANAANSRYGISLGALVPRGERGALMISLDSMFRISSNPFFPYLLARIDEAIAKPAQAGSAPAGAARPANLAPNVFTEKPDPEFDDMERKALDLEQDSETIP
jgi:alpha-beta hydrolase superfamily lysophospholipase